MMQTPEDQFLRRSSRNALTEIPTRVSLFNSDREGRRSFNNNFRNTMVNGGMQIHDGNNTMPISFLSPSPSPDEMIIRQRGRRLIPITFSPDIDDIKRTRSAQKDRTPVKQSAAGSPSSIVLRSTPRKRLLLDVDVNPLAESSLKASPKKSKNDRLTGSKLDEISDVLKAYTSNQLITIIEQLVAKHPELKTELEKVLPEPDLTLFETHLTDLKKNVSKALPVSRLSSKTDAIAYHRAATHLQTFKKVLFEYGSRLVESKCWNTVVEFIQIGWKITRTIPVFDSPSHNSSRRQCFKFLAAQCSLAIKNGEFPADVLAGIKSKLTPFLVDSEEIKLCLAQLKDADNV